MNKWHTYVSNAQKHMIQNKLEATGKRLDSFYGWMSFADERSQCVNKMDIPHPRLFWAKDVYFFNPADDPTLRVFFGQSGPRCHLCGGPVKCIGPAPQGPRPVIGEHTDFYVMPVLLSCFSTDPSHCKAKRNITRYDFSSLVEEFVHSLPRAVSCRLPIEVISRRTLVSRNLMFRIRRGAASGGGSFAHLARDIHEGHVLQYYQAKYEYMTCCDTWRTQIQGQMAPCVTFEDFGGMDCCQGYNAQTISDKTLRHLYTLDFESRSNYIDAHLASILAEHAKTDSTFIAQTENGVGRSMLWTMMNEFKFIVAVALLSDESKQPLTQMFEGIRGRIHSAQAVNPHVPTIRTVTVDRDCCNGTLNSPAQPSDNTTPSKLVQLWSIVNPGIIVYLDIFHWMHRLHNGLTNRCSCRLHLLENKK